MLLFCRNSWALLLVAALLATSSAVTGFVSPQQHARKLLSKRTTFSPPRPSLTIGDSTTASTTTTSALQLLPVQLLSDATSAVGGSSSFEMNPLLFYLFQTMISNGIPAIFTLVVIGFTAKQFRGKKDTDELSFRSNNSVVSPLSQLYDDLYGDQDQDPFKRNSRGMFNPFRPDSNSKRGGGDLPKNTGVPAKQYLQVTHVNQKYDSYKYSLVAATQSKAVAAAQYRQSAFDRAWGRTLALSPSVHQQLQQLEQTFLKEVSTKQQALSSLQASLAQTALDEEMEKMGMKSVYQLDPPDIIVDSNSTRASVGGAVVVKGSGSSSRPHGRRSAQLSQVSKLQTELTLLETEFLQKVVTTVGPTHAASVRTALLSGGGGGSSFWWDRAQRPLSNLLSAAAANGSDESSLSSMGKKVFVTRFPGDATASQVSNLREEVTAIVASATSGADEVVVVLQTGGGTVTGYGLAAAQLLRFKQAGLRLTIAVEQVAASGGYMMACIADKIVASPFAVLGSIGVISDIPNVYERLKQEGIEFQTVTAGK